MRAGEGRVALVTGANSGIGRATARALAGEGYITVLSDLEEQAGREAVAQCEREGALCNFIHCDVSKEAEIENLIAEVVARHGRLDAAFNNAGTLGELGSTADCPTDNFDSVIAVNLRGTFLCMRAELRQMARQETGGTIVNCSSVAG